MKRSDLSQQDINALAKAARLNLSDERLAALTETMPAIFEMLDNLDGVAASETPPAFAFQAKWNGQQ